MSGQADDPCANFEMEFVNVDTLPGVFVIRTGAALSLLYGETFQNRIDERWVYDTVYLTMSDGGQWLAVWEVVRSEDSDDVENHIWMYDVLSDHEPVLLYTFPLESPPPYRNYGASWFDSETLILGWSGRFDGDEGELLIRPFDNPIRYVPLQLEIGGGYIRSYSPDGRRVLGRADQQNGFFIFELPTGEIEFLQGRELPGVMHLAPGPAWSPDGRLAYTAPIVHLETYDRRSEEWFIRDFENDTNDQISNLLDEFGGAEILADMAWSPDGQYIAFTMTAFAISQPRQALYVMDSYTGEVVPACILPDNRGVNVFQPFFWSPDSEYIAFVYDEDLIVFHLETRTFSRIMENVISLLDWR